MTFFGRLVRKDVKVEHCVDGLPRGIYIVGDDILPADFIGRVNRLRASAMGFLAVAQVGRRVGEVADTLSDSAFLRGDALLRNITIFYNYLYIRYYIKPFKAYATKPQQKYHKMCAHTFEVYASPVKIKL